MYRLTAQLLETSAFDEAKKIRAAANSANTIANTKLQAVRAEVFKELGLHESVGGLTPDAVRNDPRYAKALSDYDHSFAQLREVNGVMNKKFAREIRADRRATMERRERGEF